MRLLRVHISNAATCGGLLDGFEIKLRPPSVPCEAFAPLCLIGPNGAGKSQFLQILAEMFQAAFHAVVPGEERRDGNTGLEFEMEYELRPEGQAANVRVRISRKKEGRRNPVVCIQKLDSQEWTDCDLTAEETKSLLPTKVVGYTSGDNETLSLPFLLSRSGYADEVAKAALKPSARNVAIPDTRLMLIDYGTHLEVLVANLVLADSEQTKALLDHARLDSLHSFRCIIQLAHRAVPNAPARKAAGSRRKGVQLTDELERYIQHLCDCATCYDYDEKSECYTFDFFADSSTTEAFQNCWSSAFALYSAFHKLAMLNDLAIPRGTRERFKKDTEERRFASRLPEPQDEEKVFRFASVNFRSRNSDQKVDYVSLSDGEHQFAQVLGTFRMISSPNVLFLLDEPESHFNPRWRVEFVAKLNDLPTARGKRRDADAEVSRQETLLTTHAPFVPSDMKRERVLIFRKDEAAGKIECERPGIETFGTTFDAILDECFRVRPPISRESRSEIEALRQSNNPEEIKAGMARLGYSVEKAMLGDLLRQLTRPDEQ